MMKQESTKSVSIIYVSLGKTNGHIMISDNVQDMEICVMNKAKADRLIVPTKHDQVQKN